MKNHNTKIKILAAIHTLPTIKSVNVLLVDNVMQELLKKIDVELDWLIFMPERVLKNVGKSYEKIFDIHNFKNALEVIEEINPDVLLSLNSGPIDIALMLVARSKNIPIVKGNFDILNEKEISKQQLLFAHTKQFFEDSVITDTNKKNRKFSRRGRFFLYKLGILIRTQIALKNNFAEIIKKNIWYFKLLMNLNKRRYYVEFTATVNWVQNKRVKKYLEDAGYTSTISVIGNPIYDEMFKRVSKFKIRKIEKPIKILFLTAPLFEHAFITKTQRDKMFKDTVKTIIKEKQNMQLTIKIHPAGEKIEEYKNMLNEIDPTIPIFQKGDIIKFIEESDVIISYFTTSTVNVFAAIAKKPMITTNFYGLQGDEYVKNGIALECKQAKNIINCINQVLESKEEISKRIDKFLKESLYNTDGKASERLSNIIISVLPQDKISK